MDKAVEHFEKVIFSFFQKTKEEYNYPKEQMSLVRWKSCVKKLLWSGDCSTQPYK